MKIAIVCFMNDLASKNIYDSLINNYCFKEQEVIFDNYKIHQLNSEQTHNEIILLRTNKESVYYENLDLEIKKQIDLKSDIIIFATKHQSASGINSLSCHAPGNWSKAMYGGEDNKVCIALPNLHKLFFEDMQSLNEKKELGYEVILECTHHGPSIETPCIFIEIGSEESSWENKEAGNLIARVIIDNIVELNESIFDSDQIVGLGIGGLHHCPEFTKLFKNNILISHVCPKYMLEELGYNALKDTISRSKPKINSIIFDWKGLGKYKEKIKVFSERLEQEFGLKLYKTKNLK